MSRNPGDLNPLEWAVLRAGLDLTDTGEPELSGFQFFRAPADRDAAYKALDSRQATVRSIISTHLTC